MSLYLTVMSSVDSTALSDMSSLSVSVSLHKIPKIKENLRKNMQKGVITRVIKHTK
jgi:hypothetical protein